MRTETSLPKVAPPQAGSFSTILAARLAAAYAVAPTVAEPNPGAELPATEVVHVSSTVEITTEASTPELVEQARELNPVGATLVPTAVAQCTEGERPAATAGEEAAGPTAEVAPAPADTLAETPAAASSSAADASLAFFAAPRKEAAWLEVARGLAAVGRRLAAAAMPWLRNLQARPQRRLRVLETVSLGDKRFAAILRVDEAEFLVGGGGTAGFTLLATLATPPSAAVAAVNEVRGC